MTTTPSLKRAGPIRHLLACASAFLLVACAASGAPPSGATITRLDGTTVDTTALTRQIEALTRAANVHGLTVTIFSDGEPAYTRAFGVADLSARKPLRTHRGAFKEGHGDGFQHYSIVYPEKKLGVLLMSNSDNAESIFGHLLVLTIADTSTPLEWENYLAYDRPPSGR